MFYFLKNIIFYPRKQREKITEIVLSFNVGNVDFEMSINDLAAFFLTKWDLVKFINLFYFAIIPFFSWNWGNFCIFMIVILYKRKLFFD